ncbi:MAG: galactose-1-phosphate uridylyltransferase [bacterium]|nr:galactose-1-phosphate uridylyltransferase [bacterium]
MSTIKNLKKAKFPSELRYDIVSKDWILIATGRARRPESFKHETRTKKEAPKKDCPFCNIETQEKPTLIFINGKKFPVGKEIPKNWTVITIPNKFPAFAQSNSLNEKTEGPYRSIDGVGFHEIIVTKDHRKQMAQFSVEQIKEVIDVYHERYLELMNEKFVHYISIFHNHGPEAGASIFHPHSQLITLPVIDPDLQSSITGSQNFLQKQQKCVHCTMLEWEKKERKRIIFENEDFLVLVPFASRVAFETRIYPKEHYAYFERITEPQKHNLAQAFKAALGKLYKGLGNPPYNFFLHTAPCDGKNYDHYHWHWEILPKTAIWAGFELGAGIEISTIEPEKAAEYLRKISI